MSNDGEVVTDSYMAVDDARRRRACYRATHRGTREMDWLLGKFAEHKLADMNEPALEVFESLLEVPDPVLQQFFLGRVLAGHGSFSDEQLGLMKNIRQFHKIADNVPDGDGGRI